jgi:hypothetical protein
MDIDTRQKMGVIRKLYITEDVTSLISQCIQVPEQYPTFVMVKIGIDASDADADACKYCIVRFLACERDIMIRFESNNTTIGAA